jgi:polyribonucleotide nucleotidyltransferase
MDAGVPLKAPVAGVAMGLIMGNDGKHAVLTDIQGMEDFLGDMDFKVAGTAQGINALQMDIKIEGLTYDILKIALEQARLARIHILDKMNEVISIPRENLSAYAPKMHRMIIPIEKIGAVIGPGGKMIRAIQEETGTSLDIDDKGVVMIGGLDADAIEKARQRVDALTRELQVGDIFTGKVVRETNFGVFVELVPGKDGLLRKEEMASQDKDINVGDEATVVIQEIDNLGRVNLSRRSLFGEESPPRQSGPPPLFPDPYLGGPDCLGGLSSPNRDRLDRFTLPRLSISWITTVASSPTLISLSCEAISSFLSNPSLPGTNSTKTPKLVSLTTLPVKISPT